jgi:hypothetical protein
MLPRSRGASSHEAGPRGRFLRPDGLWTEGPDGHHSESPWGRRAPSPTIRGCKRPQDRQCGLEARAALRGERGLALRLFPFLASAFGVYHGPGATIATRLSLRTRHVVPSQSRTPASRKAGRCRRRHPHAKFTRSNGCRRRLHPLWAHDPPTSGSWTRSWHGRDGHARAPSCGRSCADPRSRRVRS